jgi:formate hydrogenlyase transcriptional activator
MPTETHGRVVNVDSERVTAPLALRYETLVRVSQAIGAHGDPKELFSLLVTELHRVVQFDFIGVSLRDKDTGTFQNYFIDMASRSELVPQETLTPEETLTQWVYERQEPLLRSTNEMEPCYGRLQAMLKRLSIRSICALPLTTAHRKLGAITFGSKQVDTFSRSEVRFVSQVAGYVALAFDDALNFAALRRASEELRSKNDQLQLLLDVTNQVVSNLELRDLLRAISQDVRRAMQYDYASLSLPDAENKQLRLYAVDFPEGKGFLQEDLVYSIEGSPSGTAFRTMKPLTLQSPFTGWLDYPIVQIAVREGLKSFCFLPLINRNRAIGVLVLGRLRDDAFSQADISFLTQTANQIALAVENALDYREIRELKEQLSKEKLYLEDEIRTEMNFAQVIGNSASLRKVLKRVATVAPTDSTVLIYGETGTGKELIARAIHDLSPRQSKPFVKLNCAAIPTGLLESELFGHEKGAFTGAIAQRIGRFWEARAHFGPMHV